MSKQSLSLSAFSSAAETELNNLISSFPQKVVLLFPPQLEIFLTKTIPNVLLNNKKASYAKSLKNPLKDPGTLVFITTPEPEFIADFLPYLKNAPTYHKVILTIPKSNIFVDQMIIDNGYIPVDHLPVNIKQEIYVHEFHNDFVAIEDSYFLLPCINSFYKTFIQNDMSDVFDSARALSKIQTIFGQIPQVITVGQVAEKCGEIMTGILNQISIAKSTFPQIDSLIIIDRTVDMMTPFLFSGTVEQIFDNVYGINYGRLNHQDYQDLILTQSSPAFARFRALSIGDMSNEVQKVKQEMQEIANHNNATNPTLRGNDFKQDYLRKREIVNNKPTYSKFIDIVDDAIVTLAKTPSFKPCFDAEMAIFKGQNASLLEEHLISMFNDWPSAIRLLCLEATCGSIKSAKFVQAFQREAVAEFGAAAMESMLNLEKLNILTSSKFYYSWNNVKKEFNLLDTTKDFKDPLMAHLNGIVPLTVRLVDRFKEEKINKIESLTAPQVRVTVNGEKPPYVEGSARRILVYFIGGVTLSEAGIIRQIGIKSEGKYEFIVGGTDQVNPMSLVKQICPCLEQEQDEE